MVGKTKVYEGKPFGTFFSSSLLCPKMANLSWAAWLVRPSFVHLRFSNTSSMGIFSCSQPNQNCKKISKTKQKLKPPRAQNQDKKRSFTDPLPNQPFPWAQRRELQASPPSSYSQTIGFSFLSVYQNASFRIRTQ